MLLDALPDDERGTNVCLSDTFDVDKRFFVVVDGNHRLAALKRLESEQLVRAAVLPKTDIMDILSTGTLLNFIRGIQAVDTSYDRVVWVREHIKYVH